MIWIIVGVCLIVSIIFSGIEAGILSVNRVRLKHRARMRDRAALRLEKILERPERVLVTVLMVTNLMNICALVLIAGECVKRFGNTGFVIAGAIYLPLYLIVLELLPKSLFRSFPFRALAALSGPLRFINRLLAPMHLIGEAVSRAASRLHTGEAGARKLFTAREDFKYLTVEGERAGTISSGERQMIHSVVDFRGLTARDVMTPISAADTFAGHHTVKELIARFHERKQERWAVINERGEVTGVIQVLDVLLEGRERGTVESLQRRIVKVGPDIPAYRVMRQLRAARGTIAAVIGEGAKPLGIISIEQLFQKLVGLDNPTTPTLPQS